MSQNYGCFTTMRVDALPGSPDSRGGVGVRGWERHVSRLQRDSAALFGEPVSREAMVEAVYAAVEAVDLPILVRLAVGTRDLEIAASTRAVTPSDVPLRVRAVRHDRFRPEMKHTLTAPEFAERDAALAEGLDDSLFVTGQGLLSEGTTWSLVLGRPDGTWVTPQAPALPSVTVALLADRVSIGSEPVRADDLEQFDRAAAVGSGRGVHQIASIGAWTASDGVEELVSAYGLIRLDAVF
ncbi:aminotransferase class IV [Nocardioides sp. Kera G14]|uniref:aminotransferase class IV n=1 Tax=Nocardioides sp. Kera G14 TaxID=2884264 RepID=UPI001D108DBF|nr:aminotransferase class IV [Nocardioides sp. Kera G14]UDY23937.1 aminotransferase class IV [Nocardioides sp. Kera G14]